MKAILNQDIVIGEYLEWNCDSRISDTNLETMTIDEKQLNKEGVCHNMFPNMRQIQPLYLLENIYTVVNYAYS